MHTLNKVQFGGELMKSKKNNNKNIFIIVLLILILALAVGYAAFSDILTISGTANAKGTFDLEFQNVEVVKNVGADLDKTTAVISEDKNTLTVNVANLSYPGSGVEFSVDIVNVGSIPAEVQAVTPTNITGSEKIKVTGLDIIKTDHPKIEVGSKCNIHFAVEWPVDSGEILENESSISFGLQIEYVQSTGEAFEGSTSHIDIDKNGNVINSETTESNKKTLVSQITSQDYGKSINYKATVMNNETKETEEVSNWKLLYNDRNNVYIILAGYLLNNLLPSKSALEYDKAKPYSAYSNVDINTLLDGLETESYWNEFANGVEGATATGTPTLEMVIASYNEKNKVNLEYESGSILDNTEELYVPYAEEVNGQCRGYWLIYFNDNYTDVAGCIENNGYIGAPRPYNPYFAVRPVVKLPSIVTGTVGETIEIK